VITLAFGHLDHVVDRVASDLSEDGVFLVQIVCRAKSDEKLRTVVVFAAVRHCHEASSDESQLEIHIIRDLKNWMRGGRTSAPSKMIRPRLGGIVENSASRQQNCSHPPWAEFCRGWQNSPKAR
jgi:hypothetical protein